MKAATITEIKKELINRSPKELMAICLRLSKFKVDNKELITYLLFESQEEEAYIRSVKNYLDEQFPNINHYSVYYTKKGLRKILRQLDKYVRYSGNKETEADLRIYFCQKIRAADIPLHRSTVLSNLYQRQVKKIQTAVSKLHEDLQYDYGELLQNL